MQENRGELHARAVRMLAATTVLWGLSFPVVKSISILQAGLVPGVSTWFHAGLIGSTRFGIAGLVLLILCARSVRNITRLEIWQGLGLGFFAGAGILLQTDGLSHTSASTSAFLTQGFCVVVPILVAIRDRTAPTLKVLVAVGMVIAGVAVLSGFEFRTLKIGRGEFETLLSAVFFGAQILWLERPRFSGTNANHFSIIMFATMAVISAPLVLATMRTPMDPVTCLLSPSVLGLNCILIIFCTLGAFVLMNKWQPFVAATEASIIYSAEPLLASGYAIVLPGVISKLTGIHYPNEVVTKSLLTGGALIVGANLLLQINPGKPNLKTA